MDLILVIAVSVVAPILALFSEGALRVVAGAVFLLFMPGYSLVAALYPLRRSLDGTERVALSLGTSVAMAALVGVVLNYTPWGIGLAPILVSVAGLNMLLCLVAAYRRSTVDVVDRFSVSFALPGRCVSRTGPGGKVRILVLAVTVAFAMVSGGYAMSGRSTDHPHTEFYVLGSDGYASDYPVTIPLGHSESVILGVVNQEGASVEYRVEGRLDGEAGALALTSSAGADAVPSSRSHLVIGPLGDGMSCESVVTLTPHVAGERLKAEVLLFSDRPRVDVPLWSQLGGGGRVKVVVNEAEGYAGVTASTVEHERYECRIEAWQEDRVVAEAAFDVEHGSRIEQALSFPPGGTTFKVYEGDRLVLDDTGAELSLHLWMDVPEDGQAGTGNAAGIEPVAG